MTRAAENHFQTKTAITADKKLLPQALPTLLLHTGMRFFRTSIYFMLILLGAAGALALRIGLSTAPLFLLAGLLIAEGGPINLTSVQPFLDAAASVGVVLLLLALGLEFSSEEFASSMKRHAPSSSRLRRKPPQIRYSF